MARSGHASSNPLLQDWKRPAYATLSPLPDAILTILDISMRTAGLPAPFKVSTKDEDAGKVLLAYSHDPSGSALIDMLARAVIGANQMMPDVGVGLFRACLVVATLCREGIMAWRGSMPNMGRALACVDLVSNSLILVTLHPPLCISGPYLGHLRSLTPAIHARSLSHRFFCATNLASPYLLSVAHHICPMAHLIALPVTLDSRHESSSVCVPTRRPHSS